MCIGARKSAMRSYTNISECLANEIILCAKEDTGSYTIMKKNEIEKNAKANR